MSTPQELYDNSLKAMETAEKLWKAKEFEPASTQYLEAVLGIAAAILTKAKVPHVHSITSVNAVFKKYQNFKEKKYADSIPAYTMDMLVYFQGKVGYFEGKTAFDKAMHKEVKKLLVYLFKVADKKLGIEETAKDAQQSVDVMIDSFKDIDTFRQ